jgi:DNA-binding MarR family transcriptional regulator
MAVDQISEIRSALERVLSNLNEIGNNSQKKYESLRDLEMELRRIRNAQFPRGYFSDVAWDILLDVDRAESDGLECAVTDIAVEAKIPLATILRYLKKLESDGFIKRSPDIKDRRRVLVSLSDHGRTSLKGIFFRTLEKCQGESDVNIVFPTDFGLRSVGANS